MFLRLIRYRFKDATVTAPDKLMTLVSALACHQYGCTDDEISGART